MAGEHADVVLFPSGGVAIECPDLATTRNLAAIVAIELRAGDVVLLDGALAAGKTTFVSQVCEALDCVDRTSSPTYVISNTYKCPGFDVMHIDAYRLKDVDDFHHLGLDEYFPESVALIEWGSRVARAFSNCLRIEIDFAPPPREGRTYRLAGVGQRWQPLMTRLADHPQRIS